jgi:hypothetical protein
MMMPPTSALADHLRTLRTLAEARAAVQRSRERRAHDRVLQPPRRGANSMKGT